MPTTWEKALQAVYSGLKSSQPVAGILSGRNTNEEAFLFAKLVEEASPPTMRSKFFTRSASSPQVQKILMSPDRSPNFRGAREMGVSSNGGFDALMQKLIVGSFSGAYVVGEDLLASAAEPDQAFAPRCKSFPFWSCRIRA